MDQKQKRKDIRLVADWQALMRTFIRPENEATRSTLLKYMEQILFGLNDFLGDHVGITEEASLKELARRFKGTRISRTPEKKLAAVITDIVENIAPHAVNVASPYFIGHMTSAIPFFMVHLKTIVTALNQNVVKLETSKVVSIIEKQVLAKIHRLLFNRLDKSCEGVSCVDYFVDEDDIPSRKIGSEVVYHSDIVASAPAVFVAVHRDKIDLMRNREAADEIRGKNEGPFEEGYEKGDGVGVVIRYLYCEFPDPVVYLV